MKCKLQNHFIYNSNSYITIIYFSQFTLRDGLVKNNFHFVIFFFILSFLDLLLLAPHLCVSHCVYILTFPHSIQFHSHLLLSSLFAFTFRFLWYICYVVLLMLSLPYLLKLKYFFFHSIPASPFFFYLYSTDANLLSSILFLLVTKLLALNLINP